MQQYLLAIDQGTTNSRAIIFNRSGLLISQHDIRLSQYFPNEGWVEQNPEEMFSNTVGCCQEAMKKARLNAKEIAAIGISNQRETTILWDRNTSKPIYPAIVWQDRRTTEICKQLDGKNLAGLFKSKTGLLLDPYFSATKIMWILDNIPHARERAECGELLFGTVDTYLLWRLTGGKSHVTDASNASRTMLFNITTQSWDTEILKLLNIPACILPTVLDNAAYFGDVEANLLGGAIPITGMAGDQQAAAFGQACFQSGMVKATYGTGCFMLLNTGHHLIQSKSQLLSTVAYRLNNEITYGLEGSIFSAGVTIKWLRDTVKLIKTAAEAEELAKSIPHTNGVYFVPAFTGLGAPYWNSEARGALLGLTQDSGKAHIARAALECVGYQTRDLLEAMTNDNNAKFNTLRVDGGMAVNDWLLQFLSDMLNIEVQRPTCIETSALGAAYFAGLQIGMYQSLAEISNQWQMNSRFRPTMPAQKRDNLYHGWKRAIRRVL